MKYIKSYNESIRSFLKPKSEEEVKKALKDIGGFEKYIELRLDWMGQPTVEPISDIDYRDFIDKIPNRKLAYQFWVLHGASLNRELRKYVEEIGEKIGFIRKFNWGDSDQYIFTIREKEELKK